MELTHERSHFWAAYQGWNRPADTVDVLAQITATIAAQAEGLMPWPWEQIEKPAEVVPPTDAELADALALIAADMGGGGSRG